MRFPRLGLAAGLALLASAASVQADSPKLDVLGFNLGMTPADVAQNASSSLNGALIDAESSSLTLNSFSTPQMVLGADIKEGQDSVFYSTPNVEFIKVNYSNDADPKVYYISRYRIFDTTTAPSIDSFLASVKAKYGDPVEDDYRGPGVERRMTWTFGASTRHTAGYSTANTLFENCSTWVDTTFGQNPFNRMRGGDVNFGSADLRVYPKCGTVLRMTLIPMSPDDQLVQRVEFDLGDFKALVANYRTIWDMLNQGSNRTAADLKKKAPAANL